jgi:hypothetical protein
VLALVYWEAGWRDLLIGLVALPAVATLLMLLRGRSASPLRLNAAGHLVTVAQVRVTVLIVPDAAALFYGSMTLIAWGQRRLRDHRRGEPAARTRRPDRLPALPAVRRPRRPVRAPMTRSSGLAEPTLVLKLGLPEAHGHDRAAYTDGKRRAR